MDTIFQFLLAELKQETKASDRNCQAVAGRLAEEVDRICTESKRIQDSGDVMEWAYALARHRLQQCLHYYRLGSRRGRVDLHSTLSAIVYRYINPAKSQYSYQARLTLIEDFLQSFYMESLNAFRRETKLDTSYRPKSMLELGEYMAFTERYGKRRIPLPGRRNQQLIILRAQTFSQQQPSETLVDMEQAAEGGMSEGDDAYKVASMQRLREQMVAQDQEPAEDSLRHSVVHELTAYLKERKQEDCIDYFMLRLQDLPANEIEQILGLTARQRDYLQQRFKYHLVRFTFTHRWELVHQWLEIDLEKDLGLSPKRYDRFVSQLTDQQQSLLQLKKEKRPDTEIAKAIGCTPNQVQKQWFKILEQAWEIRNEQSGASNPTDE
ncbi:heterocyst differentiation protein HetZ [filamentous cyanobacterium LEGE 11480]|uniref:Heterocyst differentiation protein HetZ n=1 Tax=Romeriopsis navalis LEGE 11480 TaxID=2777977 RepID=A0A928Z2J1_9CYAN|nr:heterocyst differentiation protein HetZ [Romeriopsis navalis LEGE 11480]